MNDIRPDLSDAIEDRLFDLITQGDAESRATFIGEPGFAVPVRFHPFYVIHVQQVNEARGEEGFGESTGMRYYRYDGYVSVDVTLSDIRNLKIGTERKVRVPSYAASKRLIEHALAAILAWGGPYGEIDSNPVVSDDEKEQTVVLLTDTIRLGMARRDDSFTNRGSFEFHIYTRRMNQ